MGFVKFQRPAPEMGLLQTNLPSVAKFAEINDMELEGVSVKETRQHGSAHKSIAAIMMKQVMWQYFLHSSHLILRMNFLEKKARVDYNSLFGNFGLFLSKLLCLP